MWPSRQRNGTCVWEEPSLDPVMLFAVLMLGVGLGTIATAVATRRHEVNPVWKGFPPPEGSSGLLDLGDQATPKDVAEVRSEWERLAGKG